MGGLIMKPKSDSASASYLSLNVPPGVDPYGVNEGILNLEHRQITNDAFARISAIPQLTKQILSLSLANNRITALVFDETSKPSELIVPTSSSNANTTANGGTTESTLGRSAGGDASDDEDDPMYQSASYIGCPKPSAAAIPLRSSTNWPILENLDLSANNELFNYGGLSTINATLRSLRLSNNGIFKVPTEVWSLVNLTKLDLSHNRLIVLPPGIALLTKLNYIKLSHNSLASTSTTSCIPEEMKYCSRLRRLDLSHNKLRELPVNYRVDRENAQRRSVTHANSFGPSANSSPRHGTGAASTTNGRSFPTVTGAGAGGPASSPVLKSSAASGKKGIEELALTAAAHSAHQPPPPIKYFDPNRVSYIQITLLNLSNNQIDSLSPSIGLLRSLNSLNLGYNKLRSLPTEIALLAELKYLDLRFNQLPSLLTEICQLPRLSKLCLQNNKISALPYEIRRLKKLTHFFISSNQLVDLPDVISEVRNVRVLKLCNNKLLTIPDSIFRLQKLRLLDLSFNKLTYLSPDVCGMPLIEDLRLWGNKWSDIPQPILYADVKKIIGYLRATERERSIIANQMRSFAGPSRGHARISSLKAMPTSNRAQSATRAHSHHPRFNPLGFCEGGGGEGMVYPASSRSVGSAPGMIGGRAASATYARGGVGGGGRGGGRSVDSGSDQEEDFENSDDEFTSMFRAVSSRVASFSHIGGGNTGALSNVGSATSRRSVTGSAKSAVLSHSLNPTPSPRDHVSTIVQPFQSSTLPLPSSSGTNGNSINPIPSPKGSGRSSVILRPIRDDQADDEDDDGDDIDVDAGSMDEVHAPPPASSGDILTDLVRREWKPFQPDAEPLGSTSTTTSSADKEQLMAEWDMQSMAIEKQQTAAGKSSGRAKIGSKFM